MKNVSRKDFPPLRLIVGISGASGAIYAKNFLQTLALIPGESHIIITDGAIRIYRDEMESSIETPTQYLEQATAGVQEDPWLHSFHVEDNNNIGGKSASGSALFDGMVVLPSSMKTVSAIASGRASNLLERSADVTLKERRRLVVVPRETPMNLIHLRNLTSITEAGGIILPASPAFYQKPETLEDLANFITARVFQLFHIDTGLVSPWEG